MAAKKAPKSSAPKAAAPVKRPAAKIRQAAELLKQVSDPTRLQILWQITLPLAVPGLISAGIFAFTLSWNEFIYALAFIQSAENKTVPVAVLTQLVEGDVYHWGSLMAGALLGSIPVAIIYSFFVEHYVAGLTAGGVKG
jgi:multiple sugar transport system permease protein